MEFPFSFNNESIERFLIVFALELFCIVHCNSRSFFFQFILLFWLLQIIKGNKPKWVNRSLENSTVNSKPLGAQQTQQGNNTITLLYCFIWVSRCHSNPEISPLLLSLLWQEGIKSKWNKKMKKFWSQQRWGIND
jgi:hypothetical protein